MYKLTLASKFGDKVHISLQVWSLGIKYTLASNLGAKVYFILQYTLNTTYTYVRQMQNYLNLVEMASFGYSERDTNSMISFACNVNYITSKIYLK